MVTLVQLPPLPCCQPSELLLVLSLASRMYHPTNLTFSFLYHWNSTVLKLRFRSPRSTARIASPGFGDPESITVTLLLLTGISCMIRSFSYSVATAVCFPVNSLHQFGCPQCKLLDQNLHRALFRTSVNSKHPGYAPTPIWMRSYLSNGLMITVI